MWERWTEKTAVALTACVVYEVQFPKAGFYTLSESEKAESGKWTSVLKDPVLQTLSSVPRRTANPQE